MIELKRLQVICRPNTIPFNIPVAVSQKQKNKNPEIMLETQKTPDSPGNFEQQQQKKKRKNNLGGIIIPDINLSYRVIVTKTSWQMHRN